MLLFKEVFSYNEKIKTKTYLKVDLRSFLIYILFNIRSTNVSKFKLKVIISVIYSMYGIKPPH